MIKKKKGTNRKMKEITGEFSAELELIWWEDITRVKRKGIEDVGKQKILFLSNLSL